MALATHTCCGLVSNVYIDIGYGVYLDVISCDANRQNKNTNHQKI